MLSPFLASMERLNLVPRYEEVLRIRVEAIVITKLLQDARQAAGDCVCQHSSCSTCPCQLITDELFMHTVKIGHGC